LHSAFEGDQRLIAIALQQEGGYVAVTAFAPFSRNPTRPILRSEALRM
jgi:hypothetical protein